MPYIGYVTAAKCSKHRKTTQNMKKIDIMQHCDYTPSLL